MDLFIVNGQEKGWFIMYAKSVEKLMFFYLQYAHVRFAYILSG